MRIAGPFQVSFLNTSLTRHYTVNRQASLSRLNSLQTQTPVLLIHDDWWRKAGQGRRESCLLLNIVKLISAPQAGNRLEGDYHDMMFLICPMVNMSLVVGEGEEGVQFSPPLERTKEIMINCLKEIVENTQKFPRIEKEIFPEYKDEDLFLLDVTWSEDYIQELGESCPALFYSTVNKLRES